MNARYEVSDEIANLTRFLEARYGQGIIQVHPLAQGWKQVYRVERAANPDWVVRVVPQANEQTPADTVAGMVDLLLWLEQQAYPAERLVRTVDGAALVTYNDAWLFVTSYLGKSLTLWQPPSTRQTMDASPDQPPVSDVAIFGALGAALGRLHTLALPTTPPLRQAGMLPTRELAWVAGELASIAERVPSHLQPEYDDWRQAVQRADRYADLPVTLIHNDCNLGNVVQTPEGEIALIDWEVAGCGPAVVDMGILLRNTYAKEDRCIKPGAIAAAVDGYCQYRRLTPAELERLPDAIRFMTLVLLAAYFPERVEQKLGDDELIYGATYHAWQAQYEATDAIAALARSRFEAHLAKHNKASLHSIVRTGGNP